MFFIFLKNFCLIVNKIKLKKIKIKKKRKNKKILNKEKGKIRKIIVKIKIFFTSINLF